MSRRQLERLAEDNATSGNIWDVDGDFLRFVQTNSATENINGLHAFLGEILENFSSEESDLKVAEMLLDCFCCDHDTDEHGYDVYHWDDEVSDLFYGISLAAIESDADRDFLQGQIGSDRLDILMEEINRLKSTEDITHKAAFSELDLARIEELYLDRMATRTREENLPSNVVRFADTGATVSRTKPGNTGATR
jgi:hypothetical protein